MKVIDVYQQYFPAECPWNGTARRAASVKLTAESEEGTVRYTVSVSFFPHSDPEDYAVPDDAYAERELYREKGHRSRKRERAFLEDIRETAGGLAASLGGEIDWENPLREARWG